MSNLKQLLSENVVCVTFIKKDGTERVINCTRNGSIIPSDQAPKGTGTVPSEDVQLRVYDVDLGAWRSFQPSSVINFEVVK